MLKSLLASPADRRLLGTSLRGPTPWVIAIMGFSIMLIAASGLALASGASALERELRSRYAVQVPAGGGDLAAITAAIRSASGVSAVDPVPESEMRRTLERWLGPAARSADLPVPALVNFDLRDGADLATVERSIAAVAPQARVSAQRERLGPLLDSLRALQWLAFALVLLLSGAAAAAVVLAARGALDTHRFMIEVMHGIGATDVQVTRLFQRKIALDALVGSVAGAFAAGIVLLVLASGAGFAGQLIGSASLSTVDLVVLALLPFALAALATEVARMAVLAALRQAL